MLSIHDVGWLHDQMLATVCAWHQVDALSSCNRLVAWVQVVSMCGSALCLVARTQGSVLVQVIAVRAVGVAQAGTVARAVLNRCNLLGILGKQQCIVGIFFYVLLQLWQYHYMCSKKLLRQCQDMCLNRSPMRMVVFSSCIL